MSQKLKLATKLLLLISMGFFQSFTVANQASKQQMESPEAIFHPDYDVAERTVSWAPVGGTGVYQVVVMNMTTNTLHSMINTGNTSIRLTGVVSGNTYGVSITKGSSSGFIIIDIIDIG